MVIALFGFFSKHFSSTSKHYTIIAFGMFLTDCYTLEQNFFRSVRRTGGSESRDGLSADRAQGDGGTGSELYDRTK